MSLSNLLVDTAYLLKKASAFNGLSDELVSEKNVQRFPCRIRQLSATESFLPQGNATFSTHRIYIEGCLSSYPVLKPESAIQICGKRYVVQSVNEARTLQGHHLEIDAKYVEGAA